MARIGQLLGTVGDALVALDPASALAYPSALAVFILELARPGPGVEHAQRLALRADDVGGMQVQPALGFVAERPQPRDSLAVVVQLGGVLDAQHHLVLGHALLAGLPVRAEHFVPADLFVAQEAIGRGGFGPAGASVGDAG